MWRDDIARVCDEFTVAPAPVDAWQAWLDDDICWPGTTVMTHGEDYPAHVLLGDDGVLTGAFDRPTARVDDPARDFSAQYGAGGEEMLRVSLAAYEEAGGRVHPGLATQARHLWEAFPVLYAQFALTTRAAKDMEAAAAMLDPDQPG